MSETGGKMANDHQNPLQFTAHFKLKIGPMDKEAKIFQRSLSCSHIPFIHLLGCANLNYTAMGLPCTNSNNGSVNNNW